MHQVFYSDEVRDFADIDLGEDENFKPAETEMARQLIDQLSVDRFDPGKFRDEFRARVLEAVEEKVAGHEVTTSPELPQAKVIDLFEALKASLEQSQDEPSEKKLKPPKKARTRSQKKKAASDKVK